MTAPIGEPPSMQEFVKRAESSMSYLNLQRKETKRKNIHVLEGEKDESDIRLEFDEPNREKRERRGARDTIEEQIWSDMTYRLIINGDLIKEKTYDFNFKFNPSLGWDKQISRFLMSVSGSINGEIRRGSNL